MSITIVGIYIGAGTDASYTGGMVEVGTYYDLSHIGQQTHPPEAQAAEHTEKLFAVPTQFIFTWFNGELKAALRIPVAAV